MEGIDRKTVQRVIAMRKKGMAWSEICEKFDQPLSWQLKVRPLMKEIDRSSVALLSPGSPKYGKSKTKAKSKA